MNNQHQELIRRVEAFDKGSANYLRGDARRLPGFAENEQLTECFCWADSPQGHRHWARLAKAIGDDTDLFTMSMSATNEDYGLELREACARYISAEGMDEREELRAYNDMQDILSEWATAESEGELED